MDETILDFRRTEREAVVALLNDYGIAATEALCVRYHEINDGYWKKLERGEVTRAQLVVNRFRDFFGENGWELRPKRRRNCFFGTSQGAGFIWTAQRSL